MFQVWRELTEKGRPANADIADAWGISVSGARKRLRGDRPGTPEDWETWAEQLLPLPQPEPAREFLEAVIRFPGQDSQAQDPSDSDQVPPKLSTASLLQQWESVRENGLQDPQRARRFANLVASEREQISQLILDLDTRILGLRGNQEKRQVAYTRIRSGEGGDPCDLQALRNEHKAMGVLLDQAKAQRDGLQTILKEAGQWAEHVAGRERLKDLLGAQYDPLQEADMAADRLLTKAERQGKLSLSEVAKLEDALEEIFKPIRPRALEDAVWAHHSALTAFVDATKDLASSPGSRTQRELDELILRRENAQKVLEDTSPLKALWDQQEARLDTLRARLSALKYRARAQALQGLGQTGTSSQ